MFEEDLSTGNVEGKKKEERSAEDVVLNTTRKGPYHSLMNASSECCASLVLPTRFWRTQIFIKDATLALLSRVKVL